MMKRSPRLALAPLLVLLLVVAASGCASDPSPGATPRGSLVAAIAAEAARTDAGPSPASAIAGPTPPVARREPHPITAHGHTLIDDYYWLRNKGASEVVSYLEAENAYTDAVTKPMQPLVEGLYAELLSRVQETDSTVPYRRGEWLYYWRTEKGKQYGIDCRKRAAAAGRPEGPEQVLIDLNEIAAREPFVDLGPSEISDDGNLFAYALDTTGFRQFTLHVRDLRTGRELPEHIERVDGVSFTRDNRTLLYVTEDATTKRADQAHRHVLGEDPSKDALVYEEKDPRFYVAIGRSRSLDYVVLVTSSATTSESYLVSARAPKAPPVLIAPREAGHEYYVEHGGGDRLYIRTNSGGRNFRVVTASVRDPARAKWAEIVPHRPDVMIEDLEAFADHVVLRERKDARVNHRSIETRPGETRPGDAGPGVTKIGTSHVIAIDQPVYALTERDGLDVAPNVDPAARTYRFNYSGPALPKIVAEEDVKTGARTVLKRYTVPNVDPARYETARTLGTARDGTRVPISLLYARGQKPDGTHPMYLTAYGAYGWPNDFAFDARYLSLVDRGIVVALAHVRGGGDLGKAWHDGGRMQTKMNTFTDFIDCAESLEKAGWAKPGAIAIEGGSAGGLLMGAVTNMRPDLWRAVVARVPFVDVITTMLDETVPLTSSELEEWGNPKIEAEYDWLIKYSPYDHVEAKEYPPLLVETSYNDSQVMYWEPAKWVAKMRATKVGAAPLLLKTNMKPAGHHGLSGRYDHLRESAFRYAWVLTQLGLGEAPASR